jgi:hypothetical protein
MFRPSLLSISWSFAAVPIWFWEPVPVSPDASASDEGSIIPAESTAASLGAARNLAADSFPLAMRLVFQGYEWRPIMTWDYIANPDWEAEVESRHDESANRARQEARHRALPAPQPDIGTVVTEAPALGSDPPEGRPRQPLATPSPSAFLFR